MRFASAAVSFLVVFLGVFFLGGWLVQPHLPPVPSGPVTVFELGYWTTNWSGALLGLLLGGVSARSAYRRFAPRGDR